MPEESRTILDGLYEISESGVLRLAVRRHSRPVGYQLKPQVDHAGYHRVQLTLNGVRRSFGIHALVALAFLGECPPDHEVHHLDHDKSNNHYSNLTYVRHRENIRLSFETRERRLTVPRGEQAGSARLTDQAVKEIREAKGQKTARALGRQYGVSHAAILDIFHRRSWTHI